MNYNLASLLIILLTSPLPAQTDIVEYVPGSTQKISQLLGDYDRHQQTQTLNQTESRYGLFGTDLGVPFSHKGRTYLLFGDCWGAVEGDAMAYTTDTDPEDGLDLIFLNDGAGTYQPITIEGVSQDAFEVPVEGVSIGGKMYIYHTTDHSSTVTMGRSVLAVSEDDGNSFSYLYDFSSSYFINVSLIEVELAEWTGFPGGSGDGLIIFGSGNYRQSDVRLACQSAEMIDSPQSLYYFKGLDPTNEPLWSEQEEDAAPLFNQPCVGELSVTFNPFLRKWLMLYNCDTPRGINFRTADYPWGPWSEPQLLFDPWEDNGYCHFIHVDWQYNECDSVHDPDRANEWGGEYGPYQLEDLATGNDSVTTIYYTLSTWNPYTVVLMKSTLKMLNYQTFVDEESSDYSSGLILDQNVPNPFHSATTIRYRLPESSYVALKVYNLKGQEIATLVEEYQTKGAYRLEWAADGLPCGMYYCRLQAETCSRSIRLLLQE